MDCFVCKSATNRKNGLCSYNCVSTYYEKEIAELKRYIKGRGHSERCNYEKSNSLVEYECNCGLFRVIGEKHYEG